MAIEIEFAGELQKMSLAESDTLVLSCSRRLNDCTLAQLKEKMQEKFPRNNVLTLDAGLTLSVVTAEAAA